MYQDHPNFISPDNSKAKIWRYFDFTKFVSLIEKKALYFVRSDKLDDLFEGALTKGNIEADIEFRKLNNISLKQLNSVDWRKYMAINSWHQNNYESAAMWKLYLKSDEGIAIQTTFENLCNSFADYADNSIFIGKVNYTDYEAEVIRIGKVFNPFLHKRKSFEHENEIRAIIWKPPSMEGKGMDFNIETINHGLYVNINLQTLIENIYISPYSQEWFFELVSSITAKYGISCKVLPSDLKKLPYSFDD